MNLKKIIKELSLVSALLLVVVTLVACDSSKNSSNQKSKLDSELVNKGELTIGLTGAYEPYSYKKDGKLDGFEVELGKRIAKQLNLKVNLVTTGKWDGLIAGVASGKFDMILNDVAITPQRQKQFSFSTPYMYSQFIIVTRKDSNKKPINSIDEIKGKTFAEGIGTNNADVATKHGAILKPTDTFATALMLLNQGRADGTINSTDAWIAYSKNHSVKDLHAAKIPTSTVKPAKIAALMSKNSPELKKKVSKAIEHLHDTGELSKLSKQYFGIDITSK